MASLYDSASLVMIPSGYKDDKLYSIKPTDGSGDFTFSRDGAGASPATRVNASGLIEKGRTNEILQSNQFDTTWVNSTSTETGGQSGYDGSSDAWLLETTGANGRLNQNLTIGVCTLSLYAKAGTLDYMRFQIVGPADANAYFNLSTGTIGTTGADAIDTTITSVGGGWYRCTMSTSSGTTIRIFPAQGDGDTSGTSGNIYIQDCQVENGLVATDYIETTTAPVSAGLLGDMPRLDYSGGATCPSLLLEPSRVNLIANSEYFPTFFSGLSVTQNATTSPEGVTNATKAVELSGTNTKAITLDSVSYTSGTTYTHSFFAKSSNRYIQMYFSNSLFTTDHANFDLVNGVVGGKSNDVTSSIEDYGNGWYICTATITAPATASVSNLLLLVDDVNATRGQAYTGDGSSFVEVYGMQVESGSYPTSYIPTYGSASTRGIDACSKTGISSLIGQTEGTLFVEVDSSFHISELSDGTSSNRIVFYTDGNNYLRNLIRIGASTSSNIQTSTTIQAGDKIALAYANNDCVIYKNGVEIGSDTSVVVPSTSKFNLGSDYGGASTTDNSTKQTLLFPTRLTNAELAALTTI